MVNLAERYHISQNIHHGAGGSYDKGKLSNHFIMFLSYEVQFGKSNKDEVGILGILGK